jgi:hypothetical protein
MARDEGARLALTQSGIRFTVEKIDRDTCPWGDPEKAMAQVQRWLGPSLFGGEIADAREGSTERTNEARSAMVAAAKGQPTLASAGCGCAQHQQENASKHRSWHGESTVFHLDRIQGPQRKTRA